MDITVQNYSELSGNVTLGLTASNGKHLDVSGSITAGTQQVPSTNHIHSDQLADLLTPMPNTITISGTATIGDGVTEVHVTKDDRLSAHAAISAPMQVKILESTVQGDKNFVEVDADIADRADRLQNGVFRSTITNHLPLGAQITVYIGTDSATVFTNPLATIGPVGFDQAVVNGDGIVTEPIVSENTVNLTADELRVFTNRSLYVAPLITLPGTNNQTVLLRASDYFTMNSIVEITARVGGKD